MTIITQILSSIGGTFAVPLLVALVLALLIGILRLMTTVRFLLRRGRRPLVIQVEYGKAALEGGEDYGVLDARLLSYLASDGLGGYVIAPGAGGSAAPAVSAESLEPSAALVRLAFPAEPAYRVDVTWPGPTRQDSRLHAAVRIRRMPGDRIVASRSFAEATTEDLVEVIGSYCVMFLLSQPSIARSTPRWERWNSDVNGYLSYRRGLRLEQNDGESARSLESYRQALDHFDRAASIDPANMLVQLHRASLLELTGKPDEAVAIYRKCTMLWPEHLEVLYRLGTSYKNTAAGASAEVAAAPLLKIRDRLKLVNLLRAWLLTWRPGQWNPGERRYWRSWISLRPWDRVNKRTGYLCAVAVAELVVELSFLPVARNGGSVNGGAAAGSRAAGNGSAPGAHGVARDRVGQARVLELLEKLAALLLHPDQAPATDRLLRASAGEELYLTADSAFIPSYGGRGYRRRRAGWLAMFNAACFFSLAISLSEACIPGDFSAEEWKLCCARASIHELGLIHRDPHNALDPQWMWRDPDLAPLRETEVGRAWQGFLGMTPPPSHQGPPVAPLRASLSRSAIARRRAALSRRRS